MAPLAAPELPAEILGRVELFAELDDAARRLIWAAGRVCAVTDGVAIVNELEAGDDVYLLLEGRIEITIGSGGGAPPRHVAWLEPGATIGEVAAFTGEPRSATATARGETRLLVFDHDVFHDLCRRYPTIAVALARVLAARQQETDRAIAALLAPTVAEAATPASAAPRRGLMRRAWIELVHSRRHDLPFLLLASFIVALLFARASVWIAVRAGVRLLPLLQMFYLGGLAVTSVCALLAVLYFRPRLRRAICVAFGSGLALAFNEMSVFIAFDVFYLDMTTRDPRLEFNVALLYHRSESLYAVALLLALALQATYLRRFYRRLAFDLGVRVRGLLHRLRG
jgi:CRP-like cAMP-binding protein